MRRSDMRSLLSLLLLCAVSCASTGVAPGRLIDVGGRRLHLVCVGHGAPTVVFESGLGEGWYSWALVQDAVGRELRACSYDRSGIGFSDPDPATRSIARLNGDLHELLTRARERPPYLLVGHSLGGLLVRKYAKSWPSEVAGLVLVDSTHEDSPSHKPAEVRQAQEQALARRREQLKQWHASGEFDEMGFHDKLPKTLVRMLTPRTATANWWDARFAENSLPDSPAESTPEDRRIDVPVVVITATQWPTPNNYPAESWKQYMTARLALQQELAERSIRSRHIMADSEHSVQMADPGVVIDAVLELGREVRESRDDPARRR
ncbi:MAG TPA: alpha/beta hydrolase [Thermoanaerobaculia bacterium]|nr:alpha/beta hydrolase [Thermoanaerobaculia bacterium]